MEVKTNGIGSILEDTKSSSSASFSNALAKLESVSEFTVELPDDEVGHVIHFAIGKYEKKWCGLVAVSIQLE